MAVQVALIISLDGNAIQAAELRERAAYMPAALCKKRIWKIIDRKSSGVGVMLFHDKNEQVERKVLLPFWQIGGCSMADNKKKLLPGISGSLAAGRICCDAFWHWI